MSRPGVICVYNARSGKRPATRCLPDLKAILEDRGIDLELIEIGTSFEDRLLTTATQRPWLAIGGIGGDGTHLACLTTLRRASKDDPNLQLPPYAVIPFGTGNNLAKSLLLRPGKAFLPRAIDVMLDGDVRPIDLGTWDEGWFCDGLAVGLDAEILERREDLKQRFGDTGIHGYALYGIGTLQALPGYRPPGASITVDGKLWHRGPITNFVVNNCHVYAGEFSLTPHARVDDGQLDAVCISHRLDNLVSYLGSWRHLHLDGCSRQIKRGTSFTIELDRPIPVQVDGELFAPRQQISIGIDPAAVMMRLPAELPNSAIASAASA
jgi:diacylglycerol kinase family enzyme